MTSRPPDPTKPRQLKLKLSYRPPWPPPDYRLPDPEELARIDAAAERGEIQSQPAHGGWLAMLGTAARAGDGAQGDEKQNRPS
jgi:hypothetical protein